MEKLKFGDGGLKKVDIKGGGDFISACPPSNLETE